MSTNGKRRKAPNLIDRKKLPDLTKEQIVSVFNRLSPVIDRSGARYALIGGGLFTMLDLDVHYTTKDIDVASDMWLDGFGIRTNPRARPSSVSRMYGHYVVNNVPIDWMSQRGKPGSEALWKGAMESAYQKDGIWLANLEFAMAIKVYAGRPEDYEVFDWFCDEGIVDGPLVRDILSEYVPFWEMHDA